MWHVEQERNRELMEREREAEELARQRQRGEIYDESASSLTLVPF